jgi:hypothetical protein
MEELNYSLWFTLVWLVCMMWLWNLKMENRKRDTAKLVVHTILVPIVATLFEYLIVR